jgi:hypothetical protein
MTPSLEDVWGESGVELGKGREEWESVLDSEVKFTVLSSPCGMVCDCLYLVEYDLGGGEEAQAVAGSGDCQREGERPVEC